jgi:two-component system, LuxR family, sensor kinase FixL
MITLVLGTPGTARSLIEEVAGSRGHELIVTDTTREASEAVRRYRPSLVVVIGLSARYRAFCRRLKNSKTGDRLILLVVMEKKTRGYQEKLFEARADDYVLGTRTSDRVNARLAFVERKLELLNERISAHALLEQRARQQAAVAELGRRALAGDSVDELMEFAVSSTASTLDVDVCKVMERVAGTDDLRLRVKHGSLDVAHGAHHLQDDDPLRMVSGMSVVISAEKRSFGVLSVHTARKRHFNEEDVNFLRVVANVLASALERRIAEEAVVESEAKARAIVETTVDAIITIDARGTVESFNNAAQQIFGYDPHEVIGQNVKMLMPSPYHEEHDGYIQSYHDTGRRNIIGIGREVTGQRKDGSTFPMDLAVSEVQLGDRKIFTGIIRDITERRNLEQRILQISDEERRRIGQDLHDGLGQMLTGIGLIGQSLSRKMEQEDHPYAENVAEITNLVKESDLFARALARGLVPVELELNGLSAALHRLVDNAERLFGVTCRFEEVGGEALIADNTAATHFYRIAQEAVSNAVKHGKASEITLTLASARDKIRLRVRDDGIGFPKKLSKDRGMGVNIMHYRARIIGGVLDIRRDPAGGTVLTCTMPLTSRRRSTLESAHS